MVRLAIDAMGSDQGYTPIVNGVANFLKDFTDTTVILVGDRDALEKALAKRDFAGTADRVQIEHASEVVEMGDKFEDMKRKKDSSIVRLVQVVKEGKADGMVALGNTVAAVGAATLGLRHIRGIKRAGLAVPIPAGASGVCVSIDMGANINAKPVHLLGYGVMASIYAEKILHIEKPRVGLLNVGEERGKGNDLINEAFALLEKAPIHFIGNVEGCDMWNGQADVVVCDGFVGNAILKASEGLVKAMGSWIKHGIMQKWWSKIGGMLARPGFDYARARGNPSTYGGVPLLGVRGVCFIGHGGSNQAGVYNSLRAAHEGVTTSMLTRIEETMATLGGLDASAETGETDAYNADQ